MGIGLNTFQHQSDASSGYTSAHRNAFRKSWEKLANKSSIVGLREMQSVRGMSAGFPLPVSLGSKVVYQSCATTLVGAVQPCLATTSLLDPTSKVLSVNF